MTLMELRTPSQGLQLPGGLYGDCPTQRKSRLCQVSHGQLPPPAGAVVDCHPLVAALFGFLAAAPPSSLTSRGKNTALGRSGFS